MLSNPVFVLHGNGLSPTAIAQQLGIPYRRIMHTLYKDRRVPYPLTDIEIAQIIKAYQSGATIDFLADLYEINPYWIKRIFKIYGIGSVYQHANRRSVNATRYKQSSRVEAAKKAIAMLTPQALDKIAEFRRQGMATDRIAAKIGISTTALRHIPRYCE